MPNNPDKKSPFSNHPLLEEAKEPFPESAIRRLEDPKNLAPDVVEELKEQAITPELFSEAVAASLRAFNQKRRH